MKANIECLLGEIGCNTIPDVLSYLIGVPAGTRLFRPGDECRSGLIVLAGRVRVGRLALSGQELLLYRIGAGEACAITTACVLGGERYPAHANVEQDVSALALPAAVFHRHLGADERFRRLVFRQHARTLGDLIGRIESITSERIEVRLARCLLARAVLGPVAATHEEIAGDIGSTREVVSRGLKVFERHGWVHLHRGRIDILDQDALAAIGDNVRTS